MWPTGDSEGVYYLYSSKIKKPVKSSKKPANEQVQRQFLKTSKKPVMYQCKVWPIFIYILQDNKVLWYCDAVCIYVHDNDTI